MIVLCPVHSIIQISCVLSMVLNYFCYVTGILYVVHSIYIDFFDRYPVCYSRYCDSSLLHYTDTLCVIPGIQIVLFVKLHVYCVISSVL